MWRLPKQSHYYCWKIAPFVVNKLLITFTEQLIIFPIKVVYFFHRISWSSDTHSRHRKQSLLAFCLYWSDRGIVFLLARHRQLNIPQALNWQTQIVVAALHSGSFGFPQQLGTVDPTLKIRQIILWCSRPVWESLSHPPHWSGSGGGNSLPGGVFCGSHSLSWIIQNSWMERHSDCTSSLFQDEDRRMAGVQARKEEEKKRESHKQTIHKVPVQCDLHLLYLSAWIYALIM